MNLSQAGIADFASVATVTTETVVPEVAPASLPLHRIKTVRRQQGINLRRIARLTGENVRDLEREESEGTDISLSRLYWWQRTLDVPVSELLVESNAPLSAPVMERARMVRVMKTVAAIQEKAENLSIRRLTETLVSQLLEIMPELAGVSAWHSVGQRRSLEELGRIAERTISMSDLMEH